MLFDPFRNLWVKATPEEVVRQSLLNSMVEKGGFPKELLSVEKSLSQIPHLSQIKNLPKRRADIICFAKNIHPEIELYPLLLIECKDEKISPKAFDQIQGYNAYLKAVFLAVANQQELYFGYYESSKGRYVFQKGLPSYLTLLQSVTKKLA